MKRLTFSLPLFSLLPIGAGIVMLFSFSGILNALRFMQCTPWEQLGKPPENAVVLLGKRQDRLYVGTQSSAAYCYWEAQWSKCTRPPYEFRTDQAPAWLSGHIEAPVEGVSVLQIIRSGNFSEVSYYSLLSDGRVFACSTNFSTEITKILRSGAVLWLLIPSIGILWSVFAFFDIFIKYGQPTYWDFWGKGTRIK